MIDLPLHGQRTGDSSVSTVFDKGGEPLLSVCVPVYNGAHYLKESLDSVLMQDFTAYELVVVDDCSSDGSAALIAECRDHRLRPYSNTERLGLVGNWNRCLELSRGKYLTLFHQDDIMQPHNLRNKIDLLERHPEAGMVFSDVKVIDGSGGIQMDRWPVEIEPNVDTIFAGRDFFARLITGYNLVCCPSVMSRRECFTRLGAFDLRLSFTADWEMWLRIALHFDVAYLHAPLVYYRLHGDNETYRFKGIQELGEEFRAKCIAMDREPGRVPNYKTLRGTVCQDLEARTLQVIAEGHLSIEAEKECGTLAAEISRSRRTAGTMALPFRVLVFAYQTSRIRIILVKVRILRWLRRLKRTLSLSL